MTETLDYHPGETAKLARQPFHWTAWLALAFGFAALGVMVLGGVAVAIGMGLSAIAGVPLPALGIVLLVCTSGFLVALRRGRGNAALSYVEQAVRLNLPLPAMLAAAEQNETGRMRLALRDLRVALEGGAPVSVAVGLALPALPYRTVDLIASAERAGSLPSTLHRLTRPGTAPGTSLLTPRGDAFLRWYPLVTLTMLGGMFFLTAIFVMPKYEDIFRDFRIELPWLTKLLLLGVGDAVVPLLILLNIIALSMLARTVGSIFAPRWAGMNPFRGLTDRIAWHLPPFRGKTHSRALADTCYVIVDAIESGRPLEWGVSEAAEVRTNVVLQSRLSDWAERLRKGMNPADAAHAAEIPQLVVGMLRTTGGVDLPDMLRFLARHYESRFSRAAILMRAAVIPGLAIGMGIPVCLFILSLFLPLMELINHMSDQISKVVSR